MKAYINNKFVTLKDQLGMGGEATVYNHQGIAVKIYHDSILDDPTIWEDKVKKLQAFPTNLPKNVLSPIDLVYNRDKEIIGFTMRRIGGAYELSFLSSKKFKAKKKITPIQVTAMFNQILITLNELHTAQVLVGDFNDLNLMFARKNIYFIDTDSYQFKNFYCVVGTEQFLDPNLFDINLVKVHKFSKETDYYAFATLYLKSLINVAPYGGIHPKYKTYIQRAKNKVSIFDKQVRYPKAAIPYDILNTKLLDFFHSVFTKGERDCFPENLLTEIEWKTCPTCGIVFSSDKCLCGEQVIGKVVQTISINNKCRATTVFSIKRGNIIYSKFINKEVKCVYTDGQNLFVEGAIIEDSQVFEFAQYFDFMRGTLVYSIDDTVFFGKERYNVDMLGNRAVFACSDTFLYFITEGHLSRTENGRSNELVDSVVKNQTWIATGKDIGFGFYRLSEKITKYFIFEDSHLGLNYCDLPPIQGKLINVKCFFSATSIAFFYLSLYNNTKISTVNLMDREGKLISSLNNKDENYEMLKNINSKAVAGNKILSATDNGLLLSEPNSSAFKETKLYSDTEPFVDYETDIFTDKKGIYAVGDKKVMLLEIQ